jgi:hypothetical protein
VFRETATSAKRPVWPIRSGDRPLAAALLRLAGLVAATCVTTGAYAESLRCNGHSAEVGDSRVALLYKCGEPTLRDTVCAPVVAVGDRRAWPLPAATAQALVGCVPVDEWLYDRGPGHLLATVRLQGGVIQSIRYARSPR